MDNCGSALRFDLRYATRFTSSASENVPVRVNGFSPDDWGRRNLANVPFSAIWT
jgi:hypothetical protein